MSEATKKGIIAFIIFFAVFLAISLAAQYIVNVFIFGDDYFELGRAIAISVPAVGGMGIVVGAVYAKKDKK